MDKEKYSSKNEYMTINSKKISEEKKKKKINQKQVHYNVEVGLYKYYEDEEYYQSYYITIPKNYLDNIEQLKVEKNDIFERGKILQFSRGNFSFDAIVNYIVG